MSEYVPRRIRHGWQVQNGVVTLDVLNPHLDRGQVRGVLTVRQEAEILYRNTTNLTNERARTKVVQALADKDVTISDGILVALDDACRQPPEPAHKDTYGRGSGVSGTVRPHTLEELTAVIKRHLLVTDRALIPVFAGTLLAHQLDGEPVWLLIVAPPGGTKTELLRTLYGYSGIFPLSELTARTLASGLDTASGDPSLLGRLSDEILVLKDLTTVLELHREERQAIFAQLREVYDGRFDKVWGTGKEFHWQGRLGFVAGVTPVIDRHHAALSVLGERFVMLRAVMPNRNELAGRAVRGVGNEAEMRAESQAAMHGFLQSRTIAPPALSEDALDKLARVADFVTRARSGVVRDGFRRDLEYAPEPEAPTRLVKVLRSLASGIALAHDRDTVSETDLAYVLRVAVDSLPDIRRRVIDALAKATIRGSSDGRVSTSQMSVATQFSSSAIRRTLEDLQALGVVAVEKGGPGMADRWQLRQEFAAVFVELRDAVTTTFPETSERPP